jgi:chromosomal replication initiation ATPase DnaA
VTSEQLSFPLPRLEALGREAFFVSPANSLAVRQVEDWRGWPQGKLVLIGPEGSGKSHLAGIWAALAGARVTMAADLPVADLPALAAGPVLVEDADRVAGVAEAEAALFHLHNLCLVAGVPLLLTARRAPRHWHIGLADLASRVEGTAVATLDALDDALLSALLVKLFSDRQIAPPPRLVDYCVRRMDRSFAAAQKLVADLDSRALATGRPIGTALAAELLDNRAEGLT